MAEKEITQESLKVKDLKEIERGSSPGLSIEELSAKLVKFGGFDLIETTIDGSQNLNPEKKARKKIFLTEKDKQEERQALKRSLQLWADTPVSYTHLRAHETDSYLVCRLLLAK